MILFAALVAAGSAAFVSCSSNDDDLAQEAPKAPVAEETIVETAKGTPFSISVNADTRATLYGANAWNKTEGVNWVNALKLYGKQPSATDPWMNDVVFTRTEYNADWLANRDANHDSGVEAPTWPVDDPNTSDVESAEATKFYAITDGAIGAGKTALISGVTKWMSSEDNYVGKFDYLLPTTTSEILWYNDNGYGQADMNEYTYVTNSELTDLMVASAETTETPNGTLDLAFKHVLAGLTIKAMFVSNAEAEKASYAIVKSVMVCGLQAAGTYTFGAATPWATNTPVNYYYELNSPQRIDAEDETLVGEEKFVTKDIVPAGTWLVIPQSVTGWDEKSNNYQYPTTGAYIAVRITESVYDLDYILCFPLTTTLNPAKNRVITINIANGRDVFDDPDTNGFAYQFYTPADDPDVH